MPEQLSWQRRLGRLTLFTLFAAAVYVVALWYLLPYDGLARRLEAQLRTQGVHAEIAGLGPAGFLRLGADQVALGPPEAPNLRWEFADVEAWPVPLSLFHGEPAVELQCRTLGGEAQATLHYRVETRAEGLWQYLQLNWFDLQLERMEASWQALQLGRVPLPPLLKDLPLRGRSSGSLDSELQMHNLARLSGSVSTTIDDAGIGAGKVQGVPLPELALGRGELRITASEGKVEVETAELKGGDLEFSYSGSLLLRDPAPRSLINGVLALRPNEQAAEELALLFALFPGPKASDGRYTARVRGSLGAPRLLKR